MDWWIRPMASGATSLKCLKLRLSNPSQNEHWHYNPMKKLLLVKSQSKDEMGLSISCKELELKIITWYSCNVT